MANKLVIKNMPTGNRNLRNTLISNFEIIQPYLDKLDTDELGVDDLKNKFDDISGKINVYEDNVQAIVNILIKYDVPIQIVNGKVVEIEEGE
ncbi:hypothetical protein [Lactiplantibacillus plantarum]|uniref:hypothetical protein n=1 Tax=Lactiplantibacillus plantarum TaxID=1590 RepID=UPI000487D584|nr:hypothetical protein [Lactiplantibacillus plantarum]AQX94075.1 hypothetical protein LC611_10220 [Lactiplantibacillus plantarum]AWL17166.1 hypothetical protein DHT46_13805 [Lactiplantibacillus plantarum]AYA81227.1 hypothetical protein DWG19_12745 [Lactiplantibacillus plantarum]AYC67702.1 hypothetical protein D5291_01075 [Lactiplantibacillus plantarum]AYC74114.1 hypothetical protein D5290_04010 [Lactiplantibacillus plantarum]